MLKFNTCNQEVHPAGGSLRPDPREIADARWFVGDALPDDLMWWHRQRIADALTGVTGAVWRQEAAGPSRPASPAAISTQPGTRRACPAPTLSASSSPIRAQTRRSWRRRA